MNSESIRVLFQAWLIDVLIWATLLLFIVLVCDIVLAVFQKTLWRSAVWNSFWIALLILPIAGLMTPKMSVTSVSNNSDALVDALPVSSDAPIRNRSTNLAKSGIDSLEFDFPGSSPIGDMTTKAGERSALPSPMMSRISITGIASVIYLCGLLWMMFVLSIGLIASRDLSKSAQPLSDETWISNYSNAFRRLKPGSTVQVLVCDRISMPMVVGVWRPVILIPLSLVKTLTAQESYAVLSHELAHIKRNDQYWNLLRKVNEALFWFHPLVWIAGERHSQARELACDDYCIYAVESSCVYGETLLKIASSQFVRPIRAGIAFARDTRIGARIKFISISEGNMFCNSNRFAGLSALFCVGFLMIALTSISIHGAAYKPTVEPVFKFKDIEQKQVIDNDDFFGMNCMDFSPDGEFLYASAWRTSTIHVFRVTGLDGELTPVQTFSHENLLSNSSVRVSPDGKWAVSATGYGKNVLLMSRNADTGVLEYADHYDSNDETTGVRFFNDGVFSPDSRFLVVASMAIRPLTSGSLSLFEVSPQGKLKWHQTEVGTPETMRDPRSVAFSKDGNTIVSSSVGSSSLVVMDLDKRNCQMSIRQVLRNGENNIRCLESAFGSRFSPDGRFVYSTGGRTTTAQRSDDAPIGVGVFQFDDKNQLRLVQQITDQTEGCESLGGGNELEVSMDGKYVVTTLTDSSSVAVFLRDQRTGQLDLAHVIQVPEDPEFSPSGLAIGNDSRTIIVSSEDSRKLYRFKIVEEQD